MRILRLIPKAAFCLPLLMLSAAFAAHDFGVEKSTDEFTGSSSCQQIVVNSQGDFTGLVLSSMNGLKIVAIIRSIGRNDDPAFNMFGVLSGDKVYVRFPTSGEVIEVVPDEVSVELGSHEVAGIFGNQELITKLLSSPSEVRVRFSGGRGSKDFTINHDVILALAAGFGAECL